jgi:hypothetical protein
MIILLTAMMPASPTLLWETSSAVSCTVRSHDRRISSSCSTVSPARLRRSDRRCRQALRRMQNSLSLTGRRETGCMPALHALRSTSCYSEQRSEGLWSNERDSDRVKVRKAAQQIRKYDCVRILRTGSTRHGEPASFLISRQRPRRSHDHCTKKHTPCSGIRTCKWRCRSTSACWWLRATAHRPAR